MTACLLSVLPGCPTPSPESPALVVVNGRPITQSEFDVRWSELPEDRRAYYEQQGGKQKFLDDLVTRELLMQEARRLGLDRSPALRERLERLREQMILEELTQQVANPAVEISAAELDAYAAAHAEAMPPEARIRTAHIVVSTIAQARELKRQLDHGGDFARLAGRFSTDKGTRGQGGDLGIYQVGSTDPAVEAAILSLKPGMVSEPIKTDAGFHLFKMISREATEQETVQAARERLRRELAAEKRLKQYEEFLARLRASAVIRTGEHSQS
jgi:peptidyl-prolyl cis-trans isomerase C